MSLKNSIIVLWVYVMYGLGLWIFFSGYLLKRIVVHKHSSETTNFANHIKCNDYTSLHKLSEAFHIHFNATAVNSVELKRFDKAVILIIDALRYDFTIYENSSLVPRYYSNKMPIFSEIKSNSPERCLWTKLIADPPTTTLQRLTGLTTGSLPTFIDLSMNFASSDIVEDSLIWQLSESGRNIVFMGDDTWESLFPNRFHRSFPFPSFNVKDLDTVDNGILSNIYTELEKPDWDVIVAHFLGVDHCGHRYGPSHPAMANKLQQMDSMIRNVTMMLKADTLLVVLGDHGMTQTGDHGGDSHDETETTLFLYSQSNLIRDNKVAILNSSPLQIDLVPTLSLLLGIPIPFSNLGSVLPQLFTINNVNARPCFGEIFDSLIGRAIATAENAFQVHRYLKEYTSISDDFSQSTVNEATDLLMDISKLWVGVVGNDSSSEAGLHELRKGYENYLKFVQSACRSKWAKFDIGSMTVGILWLILSVAINLKFAYNLTFKAPVTKLFIFFVTVCIAVLFYMQNFYLCIAFCSVASCMLSYCLQRHCKWVLLEAFKIFTLPNIIVVLITCNHFSNSFVVYDDSVMLFLLQSLIVYKFLPSVSSAFRANMTNIGERSRKGKSNKKSSNYFVWVFPASLLCLLVLIRLSSVFRKCREEQLNCETSLFLTSLESVPTESSSYHVMRLCMSWISIFVPVTVLMVTCNYMQKESDSSAAFITINYGVPFVAVCICLHWWLSVVPTEILDRILGQNQVAPARCALVASVLMFCSSWIFPLLPVNPLECPTNRIYIGSISMFAASVLLPLYLVAGDGLALSICMMTVTLAVILGLRSFLSTTESPSDLLIVLWAVSCCHWFYSTGHQPTFPSVHWNAAFVVSKEVNSYVLSGAFVVLNTFSSQIFHGITLPLLLLSSNPPKLPKTQLFCLIMKYLSIHAFKLIGSVCACFILRRHLMVWKIFTPNLIYEALGFCVTAISVFISYIFVLRVISCLHMQIKKSAGQLWFLKDD